jgi:hypothetical protein
MEQCIFCKKGTNNKYHYYVAEKPNNEREKVTVPLCTKCLRKTGVITLSIVSGFFLLTLIISAFETESEKPAETDGFVSILVLTAALLVWTFYYIYCIKTDKPLSETSVAKKLIRKAKRLNPTKSYFTPAENALLPEQTYKPLQAMTSEPTKYLIQLYRSSPKGEGFLIDSSAAETVRQIGVLLDEAGGLQLMQAVHERFAASYPVMGAARNLELMWDGIGGWRG